MEDSRSSSNKVKVMVNEANAAPHAAALSEKLGVAISAAELATFAQALELPEARFINRIRRSSQQKEGEDFVQVESTETETETEEAGLVQPESDVEPEGGPLTDALHKIGVMKNLSPKEIVDLLAFLAIQPRRFAVVGLVEQKDLAQKALRPNSDVEALRKKIRAGRGGPNKHRGGKGRARAADAGPDHMGGMPPHKLMRLANRHAVRILRDGAVPENVVIHHHFYHHGPPPCMEPGFGPGGGRGCGGRGGRGGRHGGPGGHHHGPPGPDARPWFSWGRNDYA